MIDKFGCYILDNFLYKDEQIEGEKREIMLFGITRILEDIPKYTGIFIIALLFDLLKPLSIVVAVTILYKVFIGGVHARTNIQCFIFSTLYFFTPIFFAKYLPLNQKYIYLMYLIVFLFSIYVILRIAPADTEEIPILKRYKRKHMKIQGFISLTLIYLFSLICIKSTFYMQIIIGTIFLIDLFTLKIIYRLFKCKYSYESDEFKEYYNK